MSIDYVLPNSLTDDEIKQRLLAAAVHGILHPYMPKAQSGEFENFPKIGNKPLDGWQIWDGDRKTPRPGKYSDYYPYSDVWEMLDRFGYQPPDYVVMIELLAEPKKQKAKVN